MCVCIYIYKRVYVRKSNPRDLAGGAVAHMATIASGTKGEPVHTTPRFVSLEVSFCPGLSLPRARAGSHLPREHVRTYICVYTCVQAPPRPEELAYSRFLNYLFVGLLKDTIYITHTYTEVDAICEERARVRVFSVWACFLFFYRA